MRRWSPDFEEVAADLEREQQKFRGESPIARCAGESRSIYPPFSPTTHRSRRLSRAFRTK
jgi:hypothetical protein